jgi:hypothetical protein
VPLGLGREIIDQESDGDGAEDRDQNDQRAPRRGCGEYIGVVVNDGTAGKQQIMNKADEQPEEDRSESRENPEAQGEE